MQTANRLDAATHTALMTRLKSLEGQARGIQRMLDDGRDCQEVLNQLAALRAAAHVATMQAVEAYALHCLRESPADPEQVMSRLLDVFAKLTR